jgi:hypothetical protein
MDFTRLSDQTIEALGLSEMAFRAFIEHVLRTVAAGPSGTTDIWTRKSNGSPEADVFNCFAPIRSGSRRGSRNHYPHARHHAESREGMTPDAPSFCPEQVRLMVKVQQHLMRIAELSHAAADAAANRNENLVREIDKQIENELGANERALGALHQHRKEHGC